MKGKMKSDDDEESLNTYIKDYLRVRLKVLYSYIKILNIFIFYKIHAYCISIFISS